MDKIRHKFEPMQRDPTHCGVMSSPVTKGSWEHGYVSISVECGYPRHMHIACQEPACPDFGDPSFGEGTCPESHAEPRKD